MAAPAHQRANIEGKYEVIYRELARVVHAGVAAPGEPLEKYRHLKLLTEANWAAIAWMMMNSTGQKVSGAEQDAFRQNFLTEVIDWTEGAISKRGTRAEYIISYSKHYADITCASMPADTELFIDPGCGWGHRMIDVFLAGARAPFFVGGDRSTHSRDAALAAGSLFPDMRKGWFQFDFLAPDFSPLPDANAICVFTCGAIEQVEILGAGFFDCLFERYPRAKITGIHFEPISWQIDPTEEDAAAYARQRLYNQDLYGLVQTHPEIRISRAEAVTHRQGGTAIALLVWERAGSADAPRVTRVNAT